ncbi:MAG: trigger factor [Alphaproteobacteria bacterium]|nr:trigger factor [Alphaproteobacteria bacterium]
MQVTETNAEGLRREFKIVVEARDLTDRMTARLDRLSHSANMPGFRPGKVPKTLLKQRFGKALLGEVLDETVSTSSQAAIAERSLRLATQPRVEIKAFDEGKDLEYTLAFEIMPEFDPGDIAKLEAERWVAEPSEKDINAAMQRLAQGQRKFGPAPEGHNAKKGDLLTIDFVGTVDGVEFEGGKAEGARVELGTGQFIPGFEDQLVGAEVGGKVQIKATFPSDYGVRFLAGREGLFDTTVKEIKIPEEPKVDDDLAKALGLENLDGVRTAVKEQLQKDFGAVSRRRLKRSVLDQLSNMHSFEVPPGLVDAEFAVIWGEVDAARKRGQHEPGDEGKSEDELKEQYKKLATRRVRLGLVLAEVGRRNNIAVTSEEIERAITQQAARFPGQEKAIYAYFRNNPQSVDQLRGPILEDKVIDFIVGTAKVSDKKVTPEELLDESEDEALAEAEATSEGKAKKKPKSKKDE